MMKGSSFGLGNKSDFTKETRKIPGPGAYDKPFFGNNDILYKSKRFK